MTDSILFLPAPKTELTPEQILERKRELLREKEELLAAKRREVCRDDFPKFVEIFLQSFLSAKSPQFHKEIMLKLQEMTEKKTKNRLLFIAPRGFAKSTLVSVFFTLWISLYKKNTDVFVVSATISLAKEQLRKIRKELEENQKIMDSFGEQESEKWTEEILMLQNGVNIRAKGRGFQIRGFRPDLIVCDDLEDEEVIYSKEQRDKMELWFFRTLLPSLKPDQNLVYVGTKIHQNSLIVKLKQKDEFESREYKALTDNRSIWEDLWSTEKLEALRRELGTYAFEAEYQNNPLSLQDQPIKPHMLEGVRIRGEPEYSVMAVDPAISEKTSADYRAIACFTRTDEGFKEVYSERGKWGIEEFVGRILESYNLYRPDRVVIEAVAFQKVLRSILIAAGRKRKLFIPVSEAVLGVGEGKRPRDKMTRLLSVAHLFEQRLVEVKNPELIDELLSFPHGDYDDLTDATVYALMYLINNRQGKLIKTKDTMRISPAGVKPSYVLTEPRPGVYVVKVDEIMPPIRIKKGFINIDKR